jgi:hypothetical protein
MDFKQRLEAGREQIVANDSPGDPGDNFACDYFAKSNIGSLPACLDLRLSNGRRKALPYSYFIEINLDNELGIEICTNNKRIIITGRNLAKLFDYLVAYRVKYIQANIGNDPKEDGLFVNEILIEDLDS